MGIEFEVKFRAVPQTLARIREDIPGQEVVYQMQTTYYDTPSGALSARRYTLRRRMENNACICTLKAPAKGLGRREFEVEAPSIKDAIPTLCKLSELEELPDLLREGLIDLCGARFTRIAKTLVLPDCTLELALDQGILTGGGRELPLCEVEVELKQGTEQAALAYAAQLAAAYGLSPEKESKFRRAQKLAAGSDTGKEVGHHGRI